MQFNIIFHFPCRNKIIQDIGLNLNPSTSEWLSGGSTGLRNSVLVFSTSLLLRNMRDDDNLEGSQFSSNEECRFPPVNGPKPPHESTKRLIAPNFDIHRKSNGKLVSVSSSGDNMCSSICEDESESEHVNPETSSADHGKSQSIDDKTGYISYEEGENEMKADSPTADSDQSNDDFLALDEMPAAMLKMTYKFTNTETKLLKRIFSSHGLKEAKEYEKFNILWTGQQMKPDLLRSLSPYQRVNHFPR